MRKALSLAICAITLAGVGPLAAIESKALAPLSDPLSARIEQALQLLRGSPNASGVKTQLGTADSSGNSRSLTRTQTAQAPAPDDERGSYVMALAGLMIMGVIIKRRYGKGD